VGWAAAAQPTLLRAVREARPQDFPDFPIFRLLVAGAGHTVISVIHLYVCVNGLTVAGDSPPPLRWTADAPLHGG